MECPGHPDTPLGTVTHSQVPEECIADGYPPLPGDPGWPTEEGAEGETGDQEPEQGDNPFQVNPA